MDPIVVIVVVVSLHREWGAIQKQLLEKTAECFDLQEFFLEKKEYFL